MIDNRLKKERFRDDIGIKKNGSRGEERPRGERERQRSEGERQWSGGERQRSGGESKQGERGKYQDKRNENQKERKKQWSKGEWNQGERNQGERNKGEIEVQWGKGERAQKERDKQWGKGEKKQGERDKQWSKGKRKPGERDKQWSKGERKQGDRDKQWSKGDKKQGERDKQWSKEEKKQGERDKQWSKGERKQGERDKQWSKGERKQGERENQQDKGKVQTGREERQQSGERSLKGQNVNMVRQEKDGEKDRSLREQRKSFHTGQGKHASRCPVFRKCGGCQLLDMPYEKQLEQKQKQLETLLKPYCRISPIIGMENPDHYRNKVHAVFDHDKKGNPISGVYEQNSHLVVPVESCLIEDQKADEIIGTIRGMLKSFKIRTYDEDTGYGLLRHVLIRRGFATGEIMVVLVTASPVFPSKNNFVKALREKHPEITTVIQNVNGRGTSMVLGDKEHVLYGKGYIEDILCGCRFRISSKSFYQVNSVQTEVLYKKAIEAACLTGKERVIDAYCGIGTIGIVASKQAQEVIGVELNREAVRDAIENAKINGIKNVRFFCNDAGKFMLNMADNGEHVDVVFMDPPRSGSTEEFIDSVAKMRPEKVVYVSCGPETLVRDLEYFRKKGYEAKKGWGVDMFPGTTHVEVIIMMTYCGRDKK